MNTEKNVVENCPVITEGASNEGECVAGQSKSSGPRIIAVGGDGPLPATMGKFKTAEQLWRQYAEKTAKRKKVQATNMVPTIGTEEINWKFAPIARWLREDPPETEWVFENIFPCGVVAGLSAQGGTGKSFFTLQLAVSLAIGRTVFSTFQPVKPCRVLILLGEDEEEPTQKRLSKIVRFLQLTPAEEALLEKNFLLSCTEAQPLTKAGAQGGVVTTLMYRALKKVVDELKPTLLVIDPKSRWSQQDENNNDHATRFVALLEALVKPHRGSVLITHHVNKSNRNRAGMSSIRGASAFADATRLFFCLNVVEDDSEGRRLELTSVKSNYAPHLPAPLVLRQPPEFGGAFQECLPEVSSKVFPIEALASSLADELRKQGGQKRSELKDPRTDEGKAIRQALSSVDRSCRKNLDAAIDHGIALGTLRQVVKATGGRKATIIEAVQE